MPRKKSMKQSKAEEQKFLRGILAGAVLSAFAIGITFTLQLGPLTTSSEAGLRNLSCNQSCRRDSQCAAGLTCQRPPGSYRSVCTCADGTCIGGQCKEVGGEAVEGERCDPDMTRDAHRGKEVYAPSLACESGLGCIFVTRLNGSSHVCCDPSNPNPHPNCVSDDLRIVAPNP